MRVKTYTDEFFTITAEYPHTKTQLDSIVGTSYYHTYYHSYGGKNREYELNLRVSQ